MTENVKRFRGSDGGSTARSTFSNTLNREHIRSRNMTETSISLTVDRNEILLSLSLPNCAKKNNFMTRLKHQQSISTSCTSQNERIKEENIILWFPFCRNNNRSWYRSRTNRIHIYSLNVLRVLLVIGERERRRGRSKRNRKSINTKHEPGDQVFLFSFHAHNILWLW